MTSVGFARELVQGQHSYGTLYAVAVIPRRADGGDLLDTIIKVGWSTDEFRVQRRYERRFPRQGVLLIGMAYQWTEAAEKRLHRELRPWRAAGREWYRLEVLDELLERELLRLNGQGQSFYDGLRFDLWGPWR